MTELSSHYSAVALLIKNTQALHKVLKGALVLILSDGLEHWEELLKVQHLVAHLCRVKTGVSKGFLNHKTLNKPNNR